jgi:hypothetical protein
MDTIRKQVLHHYTLPLKSNFNGMGLVPFHHTLIIVKGNVPMQISLLPEWNRIHVIPLYNGCNGWEYDTPPSSLMNSIVNPKVKITKGEGVGVCSLARSTSKVEGRVGALGCGLGKLTSNSITHMDLHKPNHKLVSAQLEPFWCIDEPRANTNSQNSLRPKLGGSHHLPPYNILCAWPWDQHPNVILSWDSQMGVPKFPKLGLLQLWGPITLCANLQLR